MLAEDNATDAAGSDQSMFVLTIFKKIKETRLKYSQEIVKVLQKIANYKEVRVKLSNKYTIKQIKICSKR